MTAILGVDPGRDSGAAVLLTGERTVAAWWTWKRMQRKDGEVWRVTSDIGAKAEVDSIWEVAYRIAPHETHAKWADPCGLEWDDGTRLVVEGLFVPRPRRGQRPVNPQSVVPLAEATGELIGGLRMTPALRPLATEWRPMVLGLRPSARAADAEAYAVKVAPTLFDWPEGAGLEAAPTKAERGALAEAACIARYGWVTLCR